jgi:hypothetical protein
MRRLILLGLLLASLAACGPQADPKTVVEVFVAARDAGDIDGAMSVVSPDVVMRAPNELQYRGVSQVREWLQATLADYVYRPSELPKSASGASEVTWRDNLYSQSGSRWVGELEWQARIDGLKISSLQGRVVRGASGIICPLCPPGTRI